MATASGAEARHTPARHSTPRRVGGGLATCEDGELGGPGSLGGKTMEDPEARKKKLNAELANGRLAMTAIVAMLFQNGTVGTTGPEMWLPSSAFESELGVQAPVGFWDPLGLSSSGDVDDFKRRREVELKHGRVAMLAAVGFLVAEQFHPLWGGNVDVPSYIAFQETPLQAFWASFHVCWDLPRSAARLLTRGKRRGSRSP